jgi:indolepyruvate ferredoxin oxidoreductase
MPTGDLVRFRDADLKAMTRLDAICDVLGGENVDALDANRLAEKLFGDAVFANMLLLGFGWQKGLVPVSLEALSRAIELNGVEVEKNHAAFAAGRLAATGEALLPGSSEESWQRETLDQIIARREAFLKDYQNAAWAARYRAAVDRARAAEQPFGSEAFTQAVARSLFKLMSYKDEYEVARLYTDGSFERQMAAEFESWDRLEVHLAPPLLADRDPTSGHLRKRRYGPWMLRAFRVVARLRRLRGTPFDIFGRTAERRMERRLIADYEATLDEILASLTPASHAPAVALAGLPAEIRGFGHVKEQNRARAEAKKAALLTELREAALALQAAE